MKRVAILGAGISGLSTSYHLGHEKCEIYEAKSYYGGHCYSEFRDGVVWDDGPHVAFGKNMYVHDVYAEAVDQDFQEFVPVMGNYFRGHWILTSEMLDKTTARNFIAPRRQARKERFRLIRLLPKCESATIAALCSPSSRWELTG